MNTITIKMNNAAVEPKVESNTPWYERVYATVASTVDNTVDAFDAVMEKRERLNIAREVTREQRRAAMIARVSREVEQTFADMGFNIKFED